MTIYSVLLGHAPLIMTTAAQMPTLDIAAPQIVIVAGGDSPSAQANARGHLFERFIARMFEAFGCETPSKSTVNVRNNGYEVDVSTRLVLTHEHAIAECKAYSSALPLEALSTFYGKLSAERFVNPATHGWFVAVPGLTADGHEFARKLEDGDKKFRLVTATHIYELVTKRAWVNPISMPGELVSDHAILLTSNGIASLAKQLDRTTRLPIRVLASCNDGRLATGDIELLAGTGYAGGMPVHDLAHNADIPSQTPPPKGTPALVTVVGSGADFEYQFPAAPAFFIGRKEILARVDSIYGAGDRVCGEVIVLNALSGWGKSSLALRIAHQVEKTGGSAVVFDTRTASATPYVAAALRKAMTDASSKGMLSMPENASFASLQSALRTLHSSTWKPKAPLLIFFDQFENVFRDAELTQEFRDLALAVRELPLRIVVGFSWKTDLVSLTENYPYRLRDEIRGAAQVINVEPFGPAEVGTLLSRLAKAAGTSLSADLKQRLREYSQGLPWLLKKLASHILTQLRAGTTEETLLAESLNIERLFEQDLAKLQVTEVEALKAIARVAPVPVTEIVERVNPDVIQSLVDQRLIVRVGERIDVYWDTFREFLVTGKLSVEDTYILRQRAASTSKLLQFIVTAGGEVSSTDAAKRIGTTPNVVFNAARDLRQLGILVPKSGSLLLAEQFRSGQLSEHQVRERVAKSLRRHTVFKKVQELIANSPAHEVSLDMLASEMPALFPAVEATPHTWRTYAISFGSWLDYSNIVQLKGQMLCVSTRVTRKTTTLLSNAESFRKTFPQTGPAIAIAYLRSKLGQGTTSLGESAIQKAHNDLYVLGIMDSAENCTPAAAELVKNLQTVPPSLVQLQQLLANVPGGNEALEQIRANSSVRPEAVGQVLKEAYGLPWAASTIRMAGTKFRAWARFAGISVAKVPRTGRAQQD